MYIYIHICLSFTETSCFFFRGCNAVSHRFGVAAVGDPPRCHSCPSNGPGRAPLLPERCRRFGDGKISGFVGMLLFFL